MQGLTLSVACLLSAGASAADLSDGVIKIGVLNDQSGLYADLSGQGSVVAAQMAVFDFLEVPTGVPTACTFAASPTRLTRITMRVWLYALGDMGPPGLEHPC